MAHRRWICLAKLLLEAEQGNWTASLCRVAFLKRSQKFSKSSRSSSEVFSNTAITSVVTMLYTTKKEGCREEQKTTIISRARVHRSHISWNSALSPPHHVRQTLSPITLQCRRIHIPYTNSLCYSNTSIGTKLSSLLTTTYYLWRELTVLPIFHFKLDVNISVFSSSLPNLHQI